MTALTWDEQGSRVYETGIRRGVLYKKITTGTNAGNYGPGVAWNGLTSVSESPSGAEETSLWADDMKYLSLYSAEEFGGTIEAYTYPDEWAECDGSAELIPGVTIGQQTRVGFGLCYRTLLGNDSLGEALGYKLHLIYGAMASPSEKSYETINDSPDAITFSWEYTTTPINVDENHKPTSVLVIDSTKVDETKLKALEAVLYGSSEAEPRLPLPLEVASILQSNGGATGATGSTGSTGDTGSTGA